MILHNVLFIVASTGFQPREYAVPKRILEHAGAHVTTASDKAGSATASDNTKTVVDIVLKDVKPEQYDGVFLIGGPGALTHLDNKIVYEILKKTEQLGKIYGAICISPRILAHAHVLKNHKATGWDEDNLLADIFSKHDAIYVKQDVVVDRKVVTASGPMAAEKFGHAIIKLLK